MLGERYGNRDIELTGVEFLDADGQAKSVFEPGERMTMRFRLDSKVQRDDVVLAFSVHLADGHGITGISTRTHGHVLKVDEGEQRAMRCNKTGQRVAAYCSRAGTEKLLGGGVDELNMSATIDHDNGIRKSRQNNRRFNGATVAHVRRRLAPTPTPQGARAVRRARRRLP